MFNHHVAAAGCLLVIFSLQFPCAGLSCWDLLFLTSSVDSVLMIWTKKAECTTPLGGPLKRKGDAHGSMRRSY
jgi:hypothetical protein